jgi:hypothetical protein
MLAEQVKRKMAAGARKVFPFGLPLFLAGVGVVTLYAIHKPVIRHLEQKFGENRQL